MVVLPPPPHLAGEPIDKTYVGASDATIYLCPGNRTHFEFIQREVRGLRIQVAERRRLSARWWGKGGAFEETWLE